MKIKYWKHACFEFITPKTRIIIDPYLEPAYDYIKRLEKIDYIVITHAHNDHMGIAIDIAKHFDSVIICAPELANYYRMAHGLKVAFVGIGGQKTLSEDFSIKGTFAAHGSAILNHGGQNFFGGPAMGFILTIENKNIYHSGDTGLFGDMEHVIGKLNKIDLALLNIGDTFTMGVEDAAIAAKWLKAKTTIPMHFSKIETAIGKKIEAKDFEALMNKQNMKTIILEDGQSIDF